MEPTYWFEKPNNDRLAILPLAVMPTAPNEPSANVRNERYGSRIGNSMNIWPLCRLLDSMIRQMKPITVNTTA